MNVVVLWLFWSWQGVLTTNNNYLHSPSITHLCNRKYLSMLLYKPEYLLFPLEKMLNIARSSWASLSSCCKPLISSCSAMSVDLYFDIVFSSFWFCLHLLNMPGSIPNSSAAIFTEPFALDSSTAICLNASSNYLSFHRVKFNVI